MVVVMVELPNRSCATLWCTPLLSCVLLYFSPAPYSDLREGDESSQAIETTRGWANKKAALIRLLRRAGQWQVSSTCPRIRLGTQAGSPERTPVLADDLVNTAKALRLFVCATIQGNTKDTLPGDRSHTGFTGR